VAVSDSDRRLQYAVGFCLFALTLATYSSVAHHEFVNYDDLHLIVNNPKLTRPATLYNLLSHFHAPETGNSNWLPLYWISLQLGFALHGPNPAAFLLTNVSIHAASAALLFAALRRFTGAVWPTGLAPLYPHPYALAPVSNQAAIAAAGFGVALVGTTILVLVASRRRPYLGVGWLWYLGTLVPMIGLVQVGMQARADRYMYLPSWVFRLRSPGVRGSSSHRIDASSSPHSRARSSSP
jgi:hypothetical protein